MNHGAGKSVFTALLIAPSRILSEQFAASLVRSEAFQVLSELKSYPSQQSLVVRLRQFRPDVILLDLNSDTEAAAGLIRFLSDSEPEIQVVGLSLYKDSDLLLLSLRLGAREFLHAPFDPTVQKEAASRLARLQPSEPGPPVRSGIVTAFASAKPGSGASTIALQSALSLGRRTKKRVLYADFDLAAGTSGFDPRIQGALSPINTLQDAVDLTPATWSSLVSNLDGVDVFAAPTLPVTGPPDLAGVCSIVEFTRSHYDYIFIELPVVFDPWSLTVVSMSDRVFLISTSELPNLHLARKAVRLLDQVGVPKDRLKILLNRFSRKGQLSRAEIEKLIECSVFSSFPNDYFSLNRLYTLGQALNSDTEIGAAVEEFAGKLADPGTPQNVEALAVHRQ